MPWEISAHTAAVEKKKKLWKWTENTSAGAMGSRRERLPSETKRREEEKNNQKQNGWLSCVGNIIEMDLFSLSLSVIYLFFFTFSFCSFCGK